MEINLANLSQSSFLFLKDWYGYNSFSYEALVAIAITFQFQNAHFQICIINQQKEKKKKKNIRMYSGVFLMTSMCMYLFASLCVRACIRNVILGKYVTKDK